jgi:hypothetical protein
MDFSVSSLIAGFIFGVIGWSLFRHGKKNAHFASLSIGITLMVYPYFVTNDYWMWGIGIALCAGAYQSLKSN